ncbi:MAG: hypothetical protein O9267_07595 [Flavobacterium sp.]|uniref:hypothetical protein n=1 Tax=Flavobacterium sp. TaxID=239 RepID=UPI0022C493DB|nr:hypothetical protein [Flavobacterium sp.]MCZ8197453.1 hypothetical protein [Flavobacterium sp.]
MIYIYGLSGLEQGFAKYSHVVKENVIETNLFLFKLVIGSIIIVSFISSIFLIYYYNSISINFFLLIVTSVCMSSLLFLYSIFRINSNFVIAQLLQNGFKIILFFIALLLLVLKRFYKNEIIFLVMLSIIITFIFGILKLKKMRFVFVDTTTRNTILVSGVFFLIATATFSIINFADRYLIENKFGLAVVGDYFYLSNIFLAPFSILQGYIGFKKLVHYKNSFTIENFKKNNRTNLIYGFLLSILLIIFYFLIIEIGIGTFDFLKYKTVFILLLLLGIAKIYSSGIYPAFDVVIDVKNLKIAKTTILIISLFILLITFFYAKTIEIIISSLIIVWVIKTLILRWFLINQETNNNFE